VKRFGGLRKLLFLHGLATLAAAIGLTVSPGTIPAVAGIHLDPGSYLIAYLLAGAEFGLSFLSFGGCRLADARALRLIAYSCIVFHGTSVVLEPMSPVGSEKTRSCGSTSLPESSSSRYSPSSLARRPNRRPSHKSKPRIRCPPRQCPLQDLGQLSKSTPAQRAIQSH
jgi:hypothetical protein